MQLTDQVVRAAAPGRPTQDPTKGHESAPSWPREGRFSYPTNGKPS